MESTVSFEPLTSELAIEETVTRYLFRERHFRRASSRLRPAALEPSPVDRATSVYRTLGLSIEEIWTLGRLSAGVGRQRTMLARGDLKVAAILQHRLRISRDEPPPRHAVIHNWPEGKSARMLIAQQLAADATLEVLPETL